ncbi:MAG: insulinase family protein [Treponema sp.]|nr:insulinase family protein [Treponema sp.]
MSNLKKDDLYKDFKVLNVFDVADYDSKAIHLRHLKTGLEVFHLLNEDSENLFAFAFRTPNPTSNGLAHIIEHSVLCGSERYPLKDPFVVLSNQSVKTYLNAMTFSDKTVYPASSIAKTDYFNLMSVYGDAVFFPRLNKEIFMQEAHRLELDEKGNPSIQGVVYNEMKGSYSSFESVASDIALTSLLKGSVYEKDSGGDPLEIPSATYQDFLDFHRRWYRPDNCFLFLCGNIPTQEQLDFLQENFLNRLEKKFPDIDLSEEGRKKRIDEFLSLVKGEKVQSPIEIYASAPSGDGEDGETVLVNWDLGRSENAPSALEKLVLAGILCNHDGSPLQKALIESNLGEDTAPQNGLFASIYTSIFTVGLRGVKKGDEKKVEKVILDKIQELALKEISEKDVESTLATMEFSHREIKRGRGPYSLSLMNRPIYGWLYGDGVENQIRLRSHLEQIRENIRNDKKYLTNLLKELFLNNKSRSLVVVTPSSSYNKEREKAEKERIEQLLKGTSLEEIKKEGEALHAFQKSSEDETCLPHLSPKDFITDGHPVMRKSNVKIESMTGADGNQLPFIKNTETTNGIIYLDLAFPADLLSPSDYPLLPAFSDCVTECGWKNLSWAQATEECALHTGGMGVNLLTMQGPDTARSRELRKKYNWINRDWLVFRISMLEEQASYAIDLLKDCILYTDFSDLKRIQDIITESRNDFESSIIPDGHIFASNRVLSDKSRKTAIDEIWNGITQYFAIKKIADLPAEETAGIFRRIFKTMKSSGAVIHATTDEKGFEILSELLPSLIKELNVTAPKESCQASDQDFFNLTKISGEITGEDNTETFLTSSQVGYCAECIPAASYGEKESWTEEVCSHWLSNNLLWEKVRTMGGAYGAFCNAESMSGLMVFASYRDPVPYDSCFTFEKCLKEAGEMDFSQEDVERAVMGCYSHFIQPQSPKGRGSSALIRLLYGITDEDREEKILGILNTSAADLKKAFKRLYKAAIDENNIKIKKKAVIFGKKADSDKGFAGNIVNLPL